MNKSTSSLTTPPAERTLTTTRVFDAPRELVYRAWTDPRQLALWFPPEHFTAPVCQLDVRPGGALRIDMKGDDDAGDFAGAVFPAVGVYREVVPNERLAFTLKGLEEGPPPMVLTTVIFEDQGRKTKLSLTVEMSRGEEQERQGWTQILENLATHVATLSGKTS